MKRILICSLMTLSISAPMLAQSEAPASPKRPMRPPRPGVKTPGVQRQMSALKPDAIFPVEGVPDWLVITEDAVWVSNKPKNTIHKLDAKTNTVTATVTVGSKPCSGITAGFGSVWAPNCGDSTLSRVDMKTAQVVATIPVGPAHTEGGLAASPDAIWMLSDPKGKLSRIDPKTNAVAAEIAVNPGSFACVYGDGAIWVSSTEKSQIQRVDPKTNTITDTIDVGPQPRFLTFGGGSVWTLNQGDGTVSRVDAKSKKLITNIEVGVPGGGGEIAYGEGSVWLTVFQIPLTRIDPATNQVAQQWVGPGGDAVRAGHGSVWLSNLREQNIWRLSAKQE